MSLVFNGQVCLVRKRRKKESFYTEKISGGEEIEGCSAASPQPLGLLAVVPSA